MAAPTCGSNINISVSRRDEIVVLKVGGDIDFATAPTLESAIGAVLVDSPVALIIDLSAVEFLSCAGLRVLSETNDHADIAGRFAVVANSPATRHPILLTDLDQRFSMYSTLDDAVTSLREDAPK
jgi:anti-sigma B factor antagonist